MENIRLVSKEEGELLARRARKQLEKRIAGKEVKFDPLSPELEGKMIPAFVTLFKRGRLQGCIGNINPKVPIGTLILDLAVQSALEDPRFKGVSPDDIDELDIEISLLSPFEPISGPDDIEIGKHGVMLEKGWHRGIFLPEVAVKNKMSAEEFLENLGLKAGLDTDAYRQSDAKLYRFTTQVFWDKVEK